MDPLSPERIYINYPYISENVKKHILRYKFASQFVTGRVLDCACGSGYGTALLSEKASEVVGVDKSEEAVGFASKQNARNNISFLVNNIETLNFPKEHFDSIVSLETLEHIDPMIVKGFLCIVKNILKNGGVFICSSPMLRHKDGKPYVTSPYHINEMPKRELLELLNTEFVDYIRHYYHQEDGYFVPLNGEHTGFCIAVMRKCE